MAKKLRSVLYRKLVPHLKTDSDKYPGTRHMSDFIFMGKFHKWMKLADDSNSNTYTEDVYAIVEEENGQVTLVHINNIKFNN